MGKLTKNATFESGEVASCVAQILASEQDKESLTLDFVSAVVEAAQKPNAASAVTELSLVKDAALMQIQASVLNSGNYLTQFMSCLSGDSISPIHRANIVASLAIDGKFDRVTMYANRTLNERRRIAKDKQAEKVKTVGK